MTGHAVIEIGLYLVVLLALVKPLGGTMARIYQGEPTLVGRLLGPFERLLYRLAGVKPEEEMGWKAYALAMLAFNAAGLFVVYILQRAQAVLPLNPGHFPAISPHLAFNTAVSFASNTNWQSYGGESTMSHLVQVLALTVQNFVSAATGMAIAVALFRGLIRRTAETIGNFWVDMVRGTLHILMPLSIVLALLLVSQGVVQTLAGSVEAPFLQPTTGAEGAAVATQTMAVGPVASQIAIKQLGTNGGGFYNVNSAHPFENATPFANFLKCLAILVIPAAFCYTFGVMVKDVRQGWAVLAAMTLLFVAFLIPCLVSEQGGNPALTQLGADQTATVSQAGGNMEGKEVRFGIASSALWATATTAASNGSVNSMHDSYTPIGGLVPVVLMQLGEVVFGGVGSGLYGMLVFAIIAVFVAGLMVGRTPEYLGKKVEAFEMKMASVAVLVPCASVLIATAVAVVTPAGAAAVANPGPHGFSEILYAFSSASNNNGSAFAGISANVPFYNTALGLVMLLGRYWIAIPVLALAGSMARKKSVPAGPGTFPTHGPLFVALLIATVILVGALTFIPALGLGPVVEHLMQERT